MEHLILSTMMMSSAARSDRTYLDDRWTIGDENAYRTIPRVCRDMISERKLCHNDRTREVWYSNAFVYELVNLTYRQRLCCKWCT